MKNAVKHLKKLKIMAKMPLWPICGHFQVLKWPILANFSFSYLVTLIGMGLFSFYKFICLKYKVMAK
jgi:hypothetical protein